MIPAIVGFLAAATLAAESFQERPAAVDFCDLVKNGADFAGKIVATEALLTRLDTGEWRLDHQCFNPILLVLPSEVNPRPSFELAASPGAEQVRENKISKNVFFWAFFVGRLDVARQSDDKQRITYGKSGSTMRLVLKDVLEPRQYPVLRR
jgi:hypothetical protein